MSLPAPPLVKAAVNATLSAFVMSASDALALLRRLATSDLVSPAHAAKNLAAQLAHVLEGSQDFSEFVAYVRLINVAARAAGPHAFTENASLFAPHTVSFSCCFVRVFFSSATSFSCLLSMFGSSSDTPHTHPCVTINQQKHDMMHA
jgi:hypothetical protein